MVALGIARDGKKHVLGLREGSTENSRMVTDLLTDLVDRGLSNERAVLFVIDGAKALRKAIRDVFGDDHGVVQRCQAHKLRNVLDYLPDDMRASVERTMKQAWNAESADLAQRQLRRLANSLDREYPSAAASLRTYPLPTTVYPNTAVWVYRSVSGGCENRILSIWRQGQSFDEASVVINGGCNGVGGNRRF